MRNWTIFRTIKGYENYEVSIHGDVRHKRLKRLKKPSYDKDGYLTVGLYVAKEKKVVFKKVHRLVGKAFIENKGFPQINHKDEVKDNNHYTNLEWCTHKYNINYGTRTARRSATIRRNNRLKREQSKQLRDS